MKSSKKKPDVEKIDSILDKISAKYSKEKMNIEKNYRKTPVKTAKRFLDEEIGQQKKSMNIFEHKRKSSRSRSRSTKSSSI